MRRLMTLLVGMLLAIPCLGQQAIVSIAFLDIILHPISVPVYDFASDLSFENQIVVNNSLLDLYIRKHIEKAEPCIDCKKDELVLGTGMIRVIYFDDICAYHTLYIDRIYTKTLQFGEFMVLDGRVINYDTELAWTVSSIVNYMDIQKTRCVDSVNAAINRILMGIHYEYLPLLPPPPTTQEIRN